MMPASVRRLPGWHSANAKVTVTTSKEARERDREEGRKGGGGRRTKDECERERTKSDEVRATGEKAIIFLLLLPSATWGGKRRKGGRATITFHSALHTDTLTLIKQYADTVDPTMLTYL